MNSLGIQPRVVRIYNDIKNGVALYDVMKVVDPETVAKSKCKIDRPPYKKFSATMTKIGNLGNVVNLGKDMGFHLVGISGNDIFDENKKLTLALLWQMMRAYSVKVICKNIKIVTNIVTKIIGTYNCYKYFVTNCYKYCSEM